jgi:hypothetical protein
LTVQPKDWWAARPLWLKLALAFLALPAWGYIVVGDITQREDGQLDAMAFAVFFFVTVAFILVEWRIRKGAHNG